MEIRQLKAEEFDERIALSQFAFQMKLSEQEIEARRKTFRPERDWGAFDENGALMSAMAVIPLEAWIQGRKIPMGGIAGVATWPDARRQGCVSKLLRHAFKVMKDNEQTISMLHPFSFAFYRKFGYEMTIERKNYTLETSLLPPRTETPGQVKRIAKPDIGVLDGIYSGYASRYNGNVARTPDWWTDRVLKKNGTTAVYYNAEGMPDGYVFYDVENKTMTVHEMAATSETARTALWTYIGNHDSMIGQATIIAPIDDSLPFLLANPRIKQEVIPYFMTRIVDAEAFAKQYAWEKGAGEEAVTLDLEDAHAPWNNGLFRLAWSAEGDGRMERLSDSEAGAETVRCDIQGLAAMLTGGRKPTWLASVGRLSGPEESLRLLERRIPERTPYLMDFF